MQREVPIDKALGRKFPEQLVIVTTADGRGRPNAMAVGWIAVASDDPPMFVLGIDDASHTYRVLRRTREFVVAYPHEGMVRETLHVGSNHGKDRDKLSECGLVTQKALRVHAPLLADAVANFECRLVRVIKPGDCPLVIGRVVAAHTTGNPSLKRLYAIATGHVLGGVRPVVRGPRGARP